MNPSGILAQAVTLKAPPVSSTSATGPADSHNDPQPAPASPLPQSPSAQLGLENDELELIPRALPLRDPSRTNPVAESDDPQSVHGDDVFLNGHVEITYSGHLLRADRIQYNRRTGETLAEGHVHLEGGDNDETLDADRAEYNLRSATGRFYNVHGSVGMHANPTAGLVSPNPMLFTGRMVIKTGPRDYAIYDGSITSCLLPNPDWLFTAHTITMTHGRVRAADSTFHLLGFPVLFLPLVTHPTDQNARQSGLLIPELGYSSSSVGGSKGTTVGEGAFLTLGRSADLTVGFDYFSLRGWREYGTVRYRGAGDNFLNGHFSAMQDRGFIDTDTGLYTNQGGEDVTADFRHNFTPATRAVGDGEYLSSYIYREAWTNNFNQAVSSDITSIGYITHQANGFALSGRADRYQGLKRISIDNLPQQEVHILHVPSLDVDAIDHHLFDTPLLWDLSSSFAGLKRVQPNFVSGGIMQRFDLRPELSLPTHFEGFNLLASAAVRETVYSRQRQAPYGPNAAPIEVLAPLTRSSLELAVDLRPPVLERTFAVPPALARFFGPEVRHTVESDLTWRNTHGIDNFLNVLRFDDADLDSDTDELQYSLTQHFFFKPNPPQKKKTTDPSCDTQPAANTDATPSENAAVDNDASGNGDGNGSLDANGIALASAPPSPMHTQPRHAKHCDRTKVTPLQRPEITWFLAQKHFFDPTFGNAVIRERRNIFDSTLNFSGVAFLTEPRETSPLLSRLRLRSGGHTDVEWDFDYDTGAAKFTSSNLFFNAHAGPLLTGLSYARLNAPGKFATEDIDTGTLDTSPVSNFSQMRLLLGYGEPTKPGLAVAGSVGLNLQNATTVTSGTTITGTSATVTNTSGNFALQYATLQASYNWNCCGLTMEYKKYSLGTVRDENSYRFNFTLANIGSAGNISHTDKLF